MLGACSTFFKIFSLVPQVSLNVQYLHVVLITRTVEEQAKVATEEGPNEGANAQQKAQVAPRRTVQDGLFTSFGHTLCLITENHLRYTTHATLTT